MGVENRIEDLGREGDHSLGKMLQGPLWATLLAPKTAHLESPDDLVNIEGFGQLRYAGRSQKVRPQRHDNNLNNCRDRMIGHRVKLSLQNLGKVFAFFTESVSTSVTREKLE